LSDSAASAALPIRKPDAESVVAKVVPATDAEKKAGVAVTVYLTDRMDGIPVHRQRASWSQSRRLATSRRVRR
jgi:hypothetical protein